jgi:hypothetical protein
MAVLKVTHYKLLVTQRIRGLVKVLVSQKNFRRVAHSGIVGLEMGWFESRNIYNL